MKINSLTKSKQFLSFTHNETAIFSAPSPKTPVYLPAMFLTFYLAWHQSILSRDLFHSTF